MPTGSLPMAAARPELGRGLGPSPPHGQPRGALRAAQGLGFWAGSDGVPLEPWWLGWVSDTA